MSYSGFQYLQVISKQLEEGAHLEVSLREKRDENLSLRVNQVGERRKGIQEAESLGKGRAMEVLGGGGPRSGDQDVRCCRKTRDNRF